MYFFPLKPITMTSAVESILEFRKSIKKRHSITIGTLRFEKPTTADQTIKCWRYFTKKTKIIYFNWFAYYLSDNFSDVKSLMEYIYIHIKKLEL